MPIELFIHLTTFETCGIYRFKVLRAMDLHFWKLLRWVNLPRLINIPSVSRLRAASKFTFTFYPRWVGMGVISYEGTHSRFVWGSVSSWWGSRHWRLWHLRLKFPQTGERIPPVGLWGIAKRSLTLRCKCNYTLTPFILSLFMRQIFHN